MGKRSRRKVKKRFFLFLAFIPAVILCLYAVKNLNLGPVNEPDVPVVKQTVTVSDAVEDKKFIICIDPGHGGYDNGTKSPSGVKEKDINLNVALKLGEILEKSNLKSSLKIMYTRTTDDMHGATQKEDLKIRCDISNNAEADLYLSLHCNFDKVSSKTKGTEIWCRFPNAKGEELALKVQKYLAESGYTKDRGIKYEADGELYVLKNTNATAVLVEMGFLSNSEDCGFLKSDKGQDRVADSIAQALLDYVADNYAE